MPKPGKSFASNVPLGNDLSGGSVPGTSGSETRETPKDNFAQGERAANPTFSILDGGNDRLDPRKNETHGKASYNAGKPTL